MCMNGMNLCDMFSYVCRFLVYLMTLKMEGRCIIVVTCLALFVSNGFAASVGSGKGSAPLGERVSQVNIELIIIPALNSLP